MNSPTKLGPVYYNGSRYLGTLELVPDPICRVAVQARAQSGRVMAFGNEGAARTWLMDDWHKYLAESALFPH